MTTRKRAPLPGLTAVLVDERGSLIRICPVGEPEPGVYAIDERQHFMDLGRVTKGTRINKGMHQTVWRAVTASGKKVSGATKADAIALMLDADHMHQVTLDDTIPALF